MFIVPNFLKQPNSYYWDPRDNRYKLTDKATPEIVEDYIHYYSVGYTPVPYDVLLQRTKQDILDYKENKHRYTINKESGSRLVAVDGKIIEEYSDNVDVVEWLVRELNKNNNINEDA